MAKIKIVLDINLDTLVNRGARCFLDEVEVEAKKKYNKLIGVYGKCDIIDSSFKCVDDSNGSLKGRCEVQCIHCAMNEPKEFV